MKHHIYYVYASATAPQGGGDAKSWLFYYKLQISPEDETYVPSMDDSSPMGCSSSPEKGDVIWFWLSDGADKRIVGCAKIDRTVADIVNDRTEYWYKGDSVIELNIDWSDEVRDKILNGELWKQVNQKLSSKTPAGTSETNENGST